MLQHLYIIIMVHTRGKYIPTHGNTFQDQTTPKYVFRNLSKIKSRSKSKVVLL